MYISVITDEISQDLEHALDFVVDLDLNHVELRSMWNKNLVDLTQDELKNVQDLINERGLEVVCLATPTFKCFLNASDKATTGDKFFAREETYEDHLKILSTSLKLANMFNVDKTRIFSFWKLQNLNDIEWNEVNKRLLHAASLASKNNIILALENEYTCNICGTDLILKFFSSASNSHIQLLWDPCKY